jgi:hypothetical protein
MLLCGSVSKGQVGELLSRDGVKNCYHHGDAELETVQPPADKKMWKESKREAIAERGRATTSVIR